MEALKTDEDNFKGGQGWIGVDLDGTLAYHDGKFYGYHHIGPPIIPMVERVNRWLSEGTDVRIFTARADCEEGIRYVKEWCEVIFGCELPVTNVKDDRCISIWDDRAVEVVKNTGKPLRDFA